MRYELPKNPFAHKPKSLAHCNWSAVIEHLRNKEVVDNNFIFNDMAGVLLDDGTAVVHDYGCDGPLHQSASIGLRFISFPENVRSIVSFHLGSSVKFVTGEYDES